MALRRPEGSRALDGRLDRHLNPSNVLERDYFYDRNMQGVDWVAMRNRYLPLVDRVADREELNKVIA
jgi:hypothetical protein